MRMTLILAAILFQVQAQAQHDPTSVPANVLCHMDDIKTPGGNNSFEIQVLSEVSKWQENYICGDQVRLKNQANAHDFGAHLLSYCFKHCNSDDVPTHLDVTKAKDDCNETCTERSKVLDTYINGYLLGRESCGGGLAKKAPTSKQ